MRILLMLSLLGCNSTASVVLEKDLDTQENDTAAVNDGENDTDDSTSNSEDSGSSTTDTDDSDPADTDTTDPDQGPYEASDWFNYTEWSAESSISIGSCSDSFFEYGVVYPDSPQEDWYAGCPQCSQIYQNYAYFGTTPYAPCDVYVLAPMYRGVDYIDTTGDGQTNEVDVYHWPTADPNNPEFLGTAQATTLSDGTTAWRFEYDIQSNGTTASLGTSFVFYNWY